MIAPTAPRQALELLAEQWEIEGIQLCDGVHASVPNAFAGQTYQRCAQELREALRAQAEAAAGLREALAFYADTENYRGPGIPYLLNTTTEEIEDDWGAIARATLAQAGDPQ